MLLWIKTAETCTVILSITSWNPIQIAAVIGSLIPSAKRILWPMENMEEVNKVMV